jgi:GMP synthase (glutamine-hydrolysing)
MKALCLIHSETEGTGTIGDYLASVGASVDTVALYAGAAVPGDWSGYEFIVSMGGPMNVYEEKEYPFLAPETALLQDAINSGARVLGVCLGSQMMARALGARVKKAPAREIGWYEVALTEGGKKDPVFRGVPPSLTVLQWHEDTFDLPAGAVHLARSQLCPHQAFRYRNSVALQFHIEINRAILSAWVSELKQENQILEKFAEFSPGLSRLARQIYENFFAAAHDQR